MRLARGPRAASRNLPGNRVETIAETMRIEPILLRIRADHTDNKG